MLDSHPHKISKTGCLLTAAPSLCCRQEAEQLSGQLKRAQLEAEEVRRERTSLIEMNNDLSNQVPFYTPRLSSGGSKS